MTEPATGPGARRSRAPVWLAEGLDIVEQRRGVLLGVTGLVVAIGIALTLLAPGVVPPVAIVGAAVAIAALLLGLAAAVAVDTTDLTVRGPRHVGAAGGELVAVLPTVAHADAAAELAAAVFEAREPGKPLLLGLAAAGRDVKPTAAWTDALAVALVRRDASVLRIDLATGRSRAPGLVEVVRDGVKLTEAVSFEPGLRLARLGAGDDHGAALESLATLPGRLPKDLDVLLVALPTAASRAVVAAVRSLDHVLIVAQRDRTSRVDLIAGLDALEAAGTQAQVALLDDRTSRRLGLVTPPDERIVAASLPPVSAARPDEPAPDEPEPAPDEPEPAPDEPPDASDRGPSADTPPGLQAPGVMGIGAAAVGAAEVAGGDAEVTGGDAEVTGGDGVADDAAADESVAQERELDPDDDAPAEDAAAHDPRDDAALEPRDVEILLGAREAAAAALAEAPPADIPQVEPTTDAGPSDAPDGVADSMDAPALAKDDRDAGTDELPSIRPEPVRDVESEGEDLLRTTAQLAHLMDDLDVRSDDQSPDQRSTQGRQR